jgi:hypothetical protein
VDELKIPDALYDELGKELNFAWMKYDKNFGGPPRGTITQLKALLRLTKIPERIARLTEEIAVLKALGVPLSGDEIYAYWIPEPRVMSFNQIIKARLAAMQKEADCGK